MPRNTYAEHWHTTFIFMGLKNIHISEHELPLIHHTLLLTCPTRGSHAWAPCLAVLLYFPLVSFKIQHICFFSLLPPECKRSRRNGLLIICQLELLNKGRPMCTRERQQRTWWVWGVKKLCGAQTAPNRCYADKIYIFWAVTPLFSANHQAGDTVLHLLPPQNAEFLDLEGFGCLNGFTD